MKTQIFIFIVRYVCTGIKGENGRVNSNFMNFREALLFEKKVHSIQIV